MSGWMPRVKGYSPAWPSRSSSPGAMSPASYSCSTSIPESVKRRGSSGPTIGAMLGLWSGVVATRQQGYVRAIQLVLALVAVMWILEVVDLALDHRLDRYG